MGPEGPPRVVVNMALDMDIENIVGSACAAPSIHNSQPWQFAVDHGDILQLSASVERALWVCDPSARLLYMSCGAALLNARLAIRGAGGQPDVWLLPHPDYSFDVLARIRISPGTPASPEERKLQDAIPRQRTNRGPCTGQPIPAPVAAAMREAARTEGAELHLLDRNQTEAVLAASAEASGELAANADHQDELRRWIGNGRNDGIPLAALPRQPAREPAPVRTYDYFAAVPSARGPKVQYERFPHVAVLTTAEDEPEDWLVAGQALQRVLLTATVSGISASFLCQLLELNDMRGDDPPRCPGPARLQMIIRLGYAAERTVSMPRRPLADVLDWRTRAPAPAAQAS
jgi:nitroreductase